MANPSIISRLRRCWRTLSHQSSKGFTLLELLVVMLIAGGIVSGLMYVVVELTGTDQREASLNETQREMQLALNYMSAELREAVYVYTGECLAGQAANDQANPPIPFCPGLPQYIPASLTNANSVPVLAFWKQQPIPEKVRQRCAVESTDTLRGVPCLAASSYALVVYSLTINQPSDTPRWKGRARITRYALTQFNNDGNAVTGYANPAITSGFDTWPLDKDNNAPARPTGNAVTLVDFVDDGKGATATATNSASCPANYSMSPPDPMLTGNLQGVRSFYACISQGPSLGQNRDILLFVRGNAYGRPGISTDAKFLPTLQTQVLSRGVLGKDPGSTGSTGS
jgi:prepilin-type N-terminal cleavage/methylation domain-containing protein